MQLGDQGCLSHAFVALHIKDAEAEKNHIIFVDSHQSCVDWECVSYLFGSIYNDEEKNSYFSHLDCTSFHLHILPQRL